MKKGLIIALFLIHYSLFTTYATAQCSVCTKTTQQLGEKPAKGLNAGILYLAFIPFAIGGLVFYKWYRANKQ